MYVLFMLDSACTLLFFVSHIFIYIYFLPPPPKVKEVMFSPLSVCLCRGYLKKLWMDLDEILRTGWVCDKDELIRFW